MSLYDADISQTIWNGKMPLKITLDPTDIDIYGSGKVWDPIYVGSKTVVLLETHTSNDFTLQYS